MSWIAIALQDDEKAALRELARREKREVKQQGALLIRQQLERLGLLPAAPVVVEDKPVRTETGGR